MMYLFVKYLAWYRKITVELPLLLSITSFLLLGSILPNFIIYRTCYVLLGYNESDCALLGRVSNNFTNELEKQVQPAANIISTVMDMPLIPVVICIFAGPLSDKHGRIPVQLAPLAGYTMSMTLFGILACFKNLSPWYFLFATIPSMLSGSAITYYAVVLAYLNDISTDHTRALRMAIFEAVMLVGFLVGTLSSSYILYAANYETVFFISAGLFAIAALYTMFILPETVEVKKDQKNSFDELVRCAYIVQIVKVVFVKRQNYNRSIIILILVAMTIMNFIANGELVVKFLFLREKLNWTLTKNNYYTGIFYIISIIGTVGGTVLLNQKLKMKESVVALIGVISFIGNSLLRGMATNDFYIYGGTVLSILSGAAQPLMRTLIGQIVPSDQMGKIFSVIMAAGGLAGVVAPYLYAILYNSTINFDSGIFNYLSAILYLFAAFIVGLVISLEMCTPKKKYEIEVIENANGNPQIQTETKKISIIAV